MAESVRTRELTILPSMCDSGARLGIPEAFALCMDLAGLHAEELGNGIRAMMDRGLFWAAVKTRLEFYRRPGLMERVSASTWPEPPGRLRQNRDYRIATPAGEVLAAGKTEWTILDTENGGMHPIRENIYDPGLIFSTEEASPAPFHRFHTRWEDVPVFRRYTVRSTDIDMGRHMNNAAYARMLAGEFSTEQRERRDPASVELHYRCACYEGDELLLQKHAAPDGALELRVSCPQEKTIALARIVYG